MKNETKKALFYLALIVVYIFQGISEGYEFSYVYYFGFILSVAVLYIIKNKYISPPAGEALPGGGTDPGSYRRYQTMSREVCNK